ncbi:60S ribosomal subunit assembly/export protein [Ascosphaera atra]|nr:60S ribosomal subunit assembly/export protein [Ascosphaera atra]
MAPNRGPAKPSKGGAKDAKSKAPPAKDSKGGKHKGGKRPPPKEQKNKARTQPELLKKKKQRVYTEKELNLPSLNMITPVGVTKPRGKKKGKVFVDDQESMATILAMVNAEKEGQIESKMLKARHLEEIREARRKEAEARKKEKDSKLENIKESLKKKNKGKTSGEGESGGKRKAEEKDEASTKKKQRKSVSFA